MNTAAELAEEILFSAAPDPARPRERNALYEHDAIGRLMEPVIGAFTPEWTVEETVEALRESVKSNLITYVWVVDGDGRLAGVVTMRDLLFGARHATLAQVMARDPFVLQAAMPLREAMKQVLDRHYPVYPVGDAAGRLTGLVRGQAMFEAQAIEISLQAGSMMGVEKEERVATPWYHSLKLRHPWLQLNLVTAFLAAAVVGLFQDTLDRLVILALFLPVLAGQSGNTGCQALAVTLRGMTLGELDAGKARMLVGKEALLGFFNGGIVGIVAGAGMAVTALAEHNAHPWKLAIIVWVALTASCIVSGLAGALIP